MVRGGFSEGIHGARGLFSLAVLVYHVAISGLAVWVMPDLVWSFLMSLKFGVELFFAISGFVILRSMLAASSPAGFLWNRATRIFPVLWASVFAVILMSLASGRDLPATLDAPALLLHTVSNLLALPGVLPLPLFLPPAWTPSFEFGFYLLCFAYLVLRDRLGRERAARYALLLFGIGFIVVAIHPRTAFFLCGMIVSAGLLGGRVGERLTREPVVWIAVFLAAWEAVAADVVPFFGPVWRWSPADWLLGTIAFVAATLALEGIARGRGLFSRLLTPRAVRWLGTISFSLYLWHPIVLAVVKAGMVRSGLVEVAGDAAQLVLLLLVLPPSLLLAHVSQVLLEKRLTRWLRDRRPLAAVVA